MNNGIIPQLQEEIDTLRKENHALRIERETLQYDDKLADEILERMGQEIDNLESELATAQAALQAQSEAIAMYKQFAHVVLGYAEDGNLYHLQVIARGVLGDSAVAATTHDTPKFKVGDKVRLTFDGLYQNDHVGEYETIAEVCDGFYRLKLWHGETPNIEYYEDELIPYNESE